jgi:aminopeptidase N
MLYYEVDQGQPGYQGIASYYQKKYAAYLDKNPDDLITASVVHFEMEPGGAAAYGTIVYTKSALFFKALRESIGDKAFFQALKNYYQTEKYKIAAPQDLLGEFEKSSGRKLGDFYQKWLYAKSQP